MIGLTTTLSQFLNISDSCLPGHPAVQYEGYEACEGDLELGATGPGCDVFGWLQCGNCGLRLSEPSFVGHTAEEMNPSLPALPNGWLAE